MRRRPEGSMAAARPPAGPTRSTPGRRRRQPPRGRTDGSFPTLHQLSQSLSRGLDPRPALFQQRGDDDQDGTDGGERDPQGGAPDLVDGARDGSGKYEEDGQQADERAGRGSPSDARVPSPAHDPGPQTDGDHPIGGAL